MNPYALIGGILFFSSLSCLQYPHIPAPDIAKNP